MSPISFACTCRLTMVGVSLVLVSALNTYDSDGANYWYSTSSFVPQRNTSFGSIALRTALSMELDVWYHGKTDGNSWENIFRIGSGHSAHSLSTTAHHCDVNDRFPAMWIDDDSHSFVFDLTDTANCFRQYGRLEIEAHSLYRVRIEYNSSWVFIAVNDSIVANQARVNQTHEDKQGDQVSIWISTGAADAIQANVTLSNIRIESFDDNSQSVPPTTVSPTDFASVAPTVSPTLSPSSQSPSQLAARNTSSQSPTKRPTTFFPTVFVPSELSIVKSTQLTEAIQTTDGMETVQTTQTYIQTMKTTSAETETVNLILEDMVPPANADNPQSSNVLSFDTIFYVLTGCALGGILFCICTCCCFGCLLHKKMQFMCDEELDEKAMAHRGHSAAAWSISNLLFGGAAYRGMRQSIDSQTPAAHTSFAGEESDLRQIHGTPPLKISQQSGASASPSDVMRICDRLSSPSSIALTTSSTHTRSAQGSPPTAPTRVYKSYKAESASSPTSSSDDEEDDFEQFMQSMNEAIDANIELSRRDAVASSWKDSDSNPMKQQHPSAQHAQYRRYAVPASDRTSPSFGNKSVPIMQANRMRDSKLKIQRHERIFITSEQQQHNPMHDDSMVIIDMTDQRSRRGQFAHAVALKRHSEPYTPASLQSMDMLSKKYNRYRSGSHAGTKSKSFTNSNSNSNMTSNTRTNMNTASSSNSESDSASEHGKRKSSLHNVPSNVTTSSQRSDRPRAHHNNKSSQFSLMVHKPFTPNHGASSSAMDPSICRYAQPSLLESEEDDDEYVHMTAAPHEVAQLIETPDEEDDDDDDHDLSSVQTSEHSRTKHTRTNLTNLDSLLLLSKPSNLSRHSKPSAHERRSSSNSSSESECESETSDASKPSSSMQYQIKIDSFHQSMAGRHSNQGTQDTLQSSETAQSQQTANGESDLVEQVISFENAYFDAQQVLAHRHPGHREHNISEELGLVPLSSELTVIQSMLSPSHDDAYLDEYHDDDYDDDMKRVETVGDGYIAHAQDTIDIERAIQRVENEEAVSESEPPAQPNLPCLALPNQESEVTTISASSSTSSQSSASLSSASSAGSHSVSRTRSETTMTTSCHSDLRRLASAGTGASCSAKYANSARSVQAIGANLNSNNSVMDKLNSYSQSQKHKLNLPPIQVGDSSVTASPYSNGAVSASAYYSN